MDVLLAAAANLNKLIIDSPQYNEYLKASAELSKFPEYREIADRFRKKQMKHEIQKANGETPEIDELAIANDYADICLITVCNEFFQAEIQLLSLIKAVYEKISEGLAIET